MTWLLIVGGVVAAGFMIVLGWLVACVAWDRYQRSRDSETVGEFVASHAALLPVESMAVTVARAQIERGENPEINVTTALLMTIERLVDSGTKIEGSSDG